MFDHSSIHSGGPPHVYHFTKLGAATSDATGGTAADDRIEGPNSSYVLAYPSNVSPATMNGGEYSLALHQETRTGPLRVVLTFSSSPGVESFKLTLPDRDYEVTVRPGEAFEGPFARKQFCWQRGGPLVKRQFACWELDQEGKTRRKAAKWKLGYDTGLGICCVNQDFSGEREVLLASAVGISIVKQHKATPAAA
ncbi:hypothetical protein JCM6882_008638 [Rhodosporidiobolus microsporus]